MQGNTDRGELLTEQERESMREEARKLRLYEHLTGEQVEIEHPDGEDEKSRARMNYLDKCLREARE